MLQTFQTRSNSVKAYLWCNRVSGETRMGRLVILLIVAAGLPGVLLGSIAAFLAFGSMPGPLLARGTSLPDQPLLVMLGLVLAALLLAGTGAVARSRQLAGLQ